LNTAVFNRVSTNVWRTFYIDLLYSKANRDDGLKTAVIMPCIAPSLAQLNVLIEESCAFLNSEGRCYDCENTTRGGGAREIVGVLARERKNRGREGERREIKTAQEDSRQNGGKNPSEVPPCSCRLSPSSSSRPSSSAAWKVR